MTTKWNTNEIADMNGKVAIVTGANSGIGYVAARELAGKGAQVVLACRSEQRGQDAVTRLRGEVPDADVRFEALDLSDLDSVKAFAERFSGSNAQLDLLINNAGVMVPPLGRTQQGFELQLGVNHFGHFALTGRLLPLLARTPGARVVTVSSMAHRGGKMDFDDLDWSTRSYSPFAAYGQSKLANLLFTFELARKLEAAGIETLAVAAHPGWTATNLQQNSLPARIFNPLFAMPTDQGALPTLFAAADSDVDSGDYIGPHAFFEVRGYPTKVGTNDRAKSTEDAARLWKISEERTGVTFDFGSVKEERRVAA